YHELTDLETNLPALKNLHVKAEEYEEEIIFLHKVDEGRADQSYGIHVAKLAELPDKLLNRASVILKQLEEKSPSKQETSNEVKALNLLELTPLEAMNLIYKLQSKLK